MMKSLWFLVFVLSLGMMGQALTPSSFLSTVDKDRLKKVFTEALGKDDLPSVSYAILGYKLLGETAPNAQEACRKLQSGVDAPDATVGNAYQAALAAKEAGCKLKLGQAVTQAVSTALASEGSVASLYYAALAQMSLGQAVDKAAVAKLLAAALKKDDSVANLGYAFNLASVLDKADVKSVFDRIEDAVVQADEVEGKMLQFEGGLSVTHLVVTGAYKLAEKMGQAPPITKAQAVKFSNYFLSRKSVQQSKGGYHLLQALTTLATNKYHVPVSVTLASTPTVSATKPVVRVRISDLMGKNLGKMEVEVESAMRKSDGAVVMAKSKMTPVKEDESLYEIDMMPAKPGRGFYELTLNAKPAKQDDRLVGNTGAMLQVKALGEVVLEDVEVGVGDADQSTAPKLTSLTHPNKLPGILEADRHHKVILKFVVRDKATREKIKVHQAFVRMVNVATKAEIVFVAEPSEAQNNLLYKFDLDVNAKSKEFGSQSGKYEMFLIIGDSVISNPFEWQVADLNLAFGEAAPSAAEAKPDAKGLKPEIRHKFREPEKRPAAVVSNAFTVLCLLPFLIMIVCWMKLGVNLSAFPFSLQAIGFHLGLGAIFGLYYMFWLRLDMFATIKYLITLGVVTFLCGNSMLSKIAEKRKLSQ